MNAEAEIIPSVQFVWDKATHKFVFRSIVAQVVDQIVELHECPCDPKMKQERANWRISIQ